MQEGLQDLIVCGGAGHSLKLKEGPASRGRSQTRGSRTKLAVSSRIRRLSSSRKRRKVK